MAEVTTTLSGERFALGDIAHVSGISWSHGWPYGCLEASWQMGLSPRTFPRALTPGATAEVWDGAVRVWQGYLSESVPGDPWEIHATGWHAKFGDLLALSGVPAPTSTPSVAVEQAILRGSLPVTVGSALLATPFGEADETAAAQYVLPLLDAWTAATGQRWLVDENGVLTVAADPTSAYYILDAAEPVRGVADDGYVTDVYPRYVSAVDPTTGEPSSYGLGHVSAGSAPAGVRERPMDAAGLGVLTSATADGYAQGQLDLNGARMGYTASISASVGELMRPGGSPVRLAQVKAGRLLRSFVVADPSGAVRVGVTADVVIGRTTYTDGEPTIQLDPVGLAPRTFVDTLQAALSSPDEFDGTAA